MFAHVIRMRAGAAAEPKNIIAYEPRWATNDEIHCIPFRPTSRPIDRICPSVRICIQWFFLPHVSSRSWLLAHAIIIFRRERKTISIWMQWQTVIASNHVRMDARGASARVFVFVLCGLAKAILIHVINLNRNLFLLLLLPRKNCIGNAPMFGRSASHCWFFSALFISFYFFCQLLFGTLDQLKRLFVIICNHTQRVHVVMLSAPAVLLSMSSRRCWHTNLSIHTISKCCWYDWHWHMLGVRAREKKCSRPKCVNALIRFYSSELTARRIRTHLHLKCVRRLSAQAGQDNGMNAVADLPYYHHMHWCNLKCIGFA